MLNRKSLYNALKDVDIVIHCAAYLGDDYEEAINSNVIGVENIASISLELGIKKFIHISTLSVYGEPKEGFYDESSSMVKNHDNIYIKTIVCLTTPLTVERFRFFLKLICSYTTTRNSINKADDILLESLAMLLYICFFTNLKG